MSDYSNKLNTMNYSYTAMKSFTDCKYAFKLGYLDRVSRENNAFSDFGIAVHKVLEAFFSGYVEQRDLANHFLVTFDRIVVNEFPPSGDFDMKQYYRNAGFDFFSRFEFDKERYKVMRAEGALFWQEGNLKLNARPDLLLEDKVTGEIVLLDYKTAKLKTLPHEKEKQMEELGHQMRLYCRGLEKKMGIKVDKAHVWFVRKNKMVEVSNSKEEVDNTLRWLNGVHSEMLNEVEWTPNNTEEQAFYCNYICGVRNHCEYKKPMPETDE